MARWALASWIVLAAAACPLAPPGVEPGAPCVDEADCASGYRCDPSLGTCVKGVTSADAGVPVNDSGTPDGGDAAGDGGSTDVALSDAAPADAAPEGGCDDKDDDSRGAGCALGPDCNDGDSAAFLWRVGWPDKDGDGFTGPSPVLLCTDGALPEGHRESRSAEVDCDDGNGRRRPGAPEDCDGLDNDCDGVADNDAGCPCDVRWADDPLHPYLVCSEGKNWSEAVSFCTEEGYRLVVIESVAESDFLYTVHRSLFPNPELGKLWIGLSDQAQEGLFVWIDGSEPVFEDFGEYEPNDNPPSGEDCVEIKASGWNDRACSFTSPYVCEAAPEPAPPLPSMDGGSLVDGGLGADAGDASDASDAQAACVDEDGDDWGAGCDLFPDCNDGNPRRFLWRVGWPDEDDDEFTGPSPVLLCTDGALPEGYRESRSDTVDCDDNDAMVGGIIEVYLDEDGDGAPIALSGWVFCPDGTLPHGAETTDPNNVNWDCDDERADRSPLLEERCDGVDNDCDGDVDNNNACSPCNRFVWENEESGESHLYLFCTTPTRGWDASRQACLERGYRLVVIETQAENNALKGRAGQNAFWIGLNDRVQEGNYVWVDDTSLDFQDFASSHGGPDDEQEDCIRLTGTYWYDAPCGARYGAICELSP